MSHVDTIEIEVKDIQCLKKAAEILGMEFREGQKKYRWFGRHVGDYPIPAGFTKKDMGKCDHALSIPGKKEAYEVGIVANKDGEGYTLLWDFYAGGFGLKDRIGDKGGKLSAAYAIEVAAKSAINDGYDVRRKTGANGHLQLEVYV